MEAGDRVNPVAGCQFSVADKGKRNTLARVDADIESVPQSKVKELQQKMRRNE